MHSARLRRALQCQCTSSACLRHATEWPVHAFGVHLGVQCTPVHAFGVHSSAQCTPSACTQVPSARLRRALESRRVKIGRKNSTMNDPFLFFFCIREMREPGRIYMKRTNHHLMEICITVAHIAHFGMAAPSHKVSGARDLRLQESGRDFFEMLSRTTRLESVCNDSNKE